VGRAGQDRVGCGYFWLSLVVQVQPAFQEARVPGPLHPSSPARSLLPPFASPLIPAPALQVPPHPRHPDTLDTPTLSTPSTPSACRSWLPRCESWILTPAATDALHPAQPQRHAVQHPPVLPTTIGRPRSRALTTACTTLTWTLTWTWTWTCSHHAVALWPQACQGR
jgi:hypothetical protein